MVACCISHRRMEPPPHRDAPPAGRGRGAKNRRDAPALTEANASQRRIERRPTDATAHLAAATCLQSGFAVRACETLSTPGGQKARPALRYGRGVDVKAIEGNGEGYACAAR